MKEQYDQALVSLRKQIDDVTRDKALAELRAKRAEYDASLIRHQTDFANELVNLDRNRFAMLKQQLEGSSSELDALRGRFEDKKQEIERSKTEVKNLLAQLEDLKNEFDSESMARVMIQNELQTLEEQLAFMKAIHEEERNELASLGTLPIDVSQFYRTELTRAIADIKNDFEALSQAQRRELEGELLAHSTRATRTRAFVRSQSTTRSKPKKSASKPPNRSARSKKRADRARWK